MVSCLLPQITEDVELVVRDDSSNMLSKEWFDDIVKKQSFAFQYHKGEKIGVDRASIFLLENAKGEFVWFLSDDDELLDGAIEAILKIIKGDDKLTLVWANYYFNATDRVAIAGRESGYFANGNDVLETLGMNIGLISTQIYRREIGLSGIDKAKKYEIGFGFVSTAIYIHVLTQPGTFFFLNGPYLLCHPTTADEFKHAFLKTGDIKNEFFNIYGISFYNIIQDFRNYFSPHAVRWILSTNFGSLWRGMLVGWVGGWDTPKGKLWRMFKYYWSFPEFWIAFPIFIMPLWFNRILFKIYKVFFFERKFILFNYFTRLETNDKR